MAKRLVIHILKNEHKKKRSGAKVEQDRFQVVGVMLSEGKEWREEGQERREGRLSDGMKGCEAREGVHGLLSSFLASDCQERFIFFFTRVCNSPRPDHE